MVKDYKRSITHSNYKNPEKLKKYYHRVGKILYAEYKVYKDTRWTKNEHELVDDNFIVANFPQLATPILGGSISFLFVLGLSLISEPLSKGGVFIVTLCSMLTVFFVIYGITQPKKEHILNRRDGLLTMSGFFWQKNITMEFKKVEFAYSTGGDDGLGAFMLEVIRPNKWQTFDIYHMFGGDCYNVMTFITWYMDKNRPLPPNPEFDTFREQDFERRKAEGFPKPLYGSNHVPTPEATPEQQKERLLIGGW